MNNPYQYINSNQIADLEPRERTAWGEHWRVEFPSAYATRYLGDSRVSGEYFFPRGKSRAPLALLVHGMGDRSVLPCRLIARDLAKAGVASFILYLVWHSQRATPAIKTHYPNLSNQEWDETYKLSVTDIRQTLDWAATRPEIIPDQLFILGISFGSFVTSIALAVDPRLKKGVLVECGGNSDKITRYSLMLRWRYKIKPAIYTQSQNEYRLYLNEVARCGWDKVEASKTSYLTDPLTFAENLKSRPLMLLNASWDEMIPKTATCDLWESLGRPPIHWYPATHASLWLWYPLFRHKITSFMAEA
jgi:dienelactone hydrolase